MDDYMNSLFSGGDFINFAIMIVAGLIVLVGVFSACVSIFLAIKYYRFNRRENSAGLDGVETARRILDANGLEHIKVKAVGSLLFGNSYSHYFKKVRLRRLTRHKKSLTALAMGSEKAALAVLDKEGDPDMKTRVRLYPIITFGPFAFSPLIIIGVVIDFLISQTVGTVTVVLAIVGLLFYVLSLVLSIKTLKTEKKAQERAYQLLRQENMATEDEIDAMHELFRLYNIQYINDIILSMLEILYYVLRIVAAVQGSNGSVKRNN